jgi:tRNA threonylcarbamoyladenosine biosynthesis protein TsaB
MILLGIETSGFEGSVALVRDQSCLGEQRLNQVGRRHAQSLVLEIGQLLRSHGMTPQDVEAVAVSHGPGSFTGLRVGMVCAKTFAYATGCKFIAVDTFAAIAENAPADVTRLFVIEDAQRDDLFVGAFSRDESRHWKQVSPIQIVSRVDFLRDRTESDVVTGPGLKKLDPAEARPKWLSATEICSPRASVIAELGRMKLNSMGSEPLSSDTDFWLASPFYLRLSAAEEKRAALVAN